MARAILALIVSAVVTFASGPVMADGPVPDTRSVYERNFDPLAFQHILNAGQMVIAQ